VIYNSIPFKDVFTLPHNIVNLQDKPFQSFKLMDHRLGIVGSGGFSMFSVEAFLENEGIEAFGVFDIDRNRAERFAQKFGAGVFDSYNHMLQDDGIDIIYIATPPNLHFEHSKEALEYGKHVICEKPAALVPEQAEEVNLLAEEKGLLYVVNLMQRYNPLYQKVASLIDSQLLGKFLHAYFENYASDENLGPEHWMWDHRISGGKFIEHAVHFFDMFEGWLGQGQAVASQKVRRSGYNRDYFSRVQSVGLYSGGLVNMYHGFDQPSRMDRQELRILFEKGELTLYEWVPVRMVLNAIVSNEEKDQLLNQFPGAELEVMEVYDGEEKECRGNFKDLIVDEKIRLEFGKDAAKGDIYKLILREMFADQVKWIKNRSHKRVITGLNGVNSLKMAWEAETKAQYV
jgi:predicted dehydrogenase